MDSDYRNWMKKKEEVDLTFIQFIAVSANNWVTFISNSPYNIYLNIISDYLSNKIIWLYEIIELENLRLAIFDTNKGSRFFIVL